MNKLNIYRWSGTVNGSSIQGEGHTITDIGTGNISGVAVIEGMPPSYALDVSGASYWCISCSNNIKPRVAGPQALSIVEMTDAEYVSTRKISHLLNGQKIGESLIRGVVSRVSEDVINIDAQVTCNYDGPLDLKASDYVLPVNITNGLISGNYVQFLKRPSGIGDVINFVEATYEWDGVRTSHIALPAQQELGIYFRDISSTRFGNVVVVKMNAIGTNTPPISTLNIDHFTTETK